MRDGCDRSGLRLLLPQPVLCTDNGAMIAAAGFNRLVAGQRTSLALDADPGLPLDRLA
jgi:N6-L-threonylcarbamoyladenine synthase